MFALSALVVQAVAQEESDCPHRTMAGSGVCIGKDAGDCAKQQAQSPICYDAEPQYTDEAAKANIKGIVRLSAAVRTDGCASHIKVVGSLGFGLDEAAVSALERYRFRKPPKPMLINLEFNFDPQFSSRNPVTGPKCEEVAHRRSNRK